MREERRCRQQEQSRDTQRVSHDGLPVLCLITRWNCACLWQSGGDFIRAQAAAGADGHVRQILPYGPVIALREDPSVVRTLTTGTEAQRPGVLFTSS